MRPKGCVGRINSMSPKLSRIFKNLPELEPPLRLEGFILAKIERERDRIIREKKILLFAGFIGSILAAIYAAPVFGQEILKSDFWSIISLMFSDINIIAGNWKDYALSLLETFPAIHIAAVLAPVFTLLLSLNLYFNSINLNIWKHQR